jgi:hypothetical protein
MNLYRDRISGGLLETTIKNILKDLKTLPKDTPHIDVAIKCLNRITADDYSFTDITSDVSTKQLLALAWHAIHDDTKRIGALDDAKHLFIEGLYEAQRGYNLSEANVDRGGVDRPICVAGTFNKIMEKLAGIHLDAQIIYITPATTALKLPVIAKEEAENYLTSIANPSTRDEYLNAVRIMEDVKSDGMEIIWPHIKEKVAQRVFGEFGSLYRDINDERFVEMVDAGVDVDVSEIPETFQQKMMGSNGYRTQAPLLTQGLFANHNKEPKAEELAANRNNPQ